MRSAYLPNCESCNQNEDDLLAECIVNIIYYISMAECIKNEGQRQLLIITLKLNSSDTSLFQGILSEKYNKIINVVLIKDLELIE